MQALIACKDELREKIGKAEESGVGRRRSIPPCAKKVRVARPARIRQAMDFVAKQERTARGEAR